MLHEQGLLSAEDIANLLRALAAIEADLASRNETRRLYRRARGSVLLYRARIGAPCRRRHGGAPAYRPLAQRYRSYAVQDGAEGTAGHARRAIDRPDRNADRTLGARCGHDYPCLYAWPAGAAFDLRPLSGCGHRNVAARRRTLRASAPNRRSLHHGCRGNHHDGLSAQPRARGRIARLRRHPAEFLWLHRVGPTTRRRSMRRSS